MGGVDDDYGVKFQQKQKFYSLSPATSLCLYIHKQAFSFLFPVHFLLASPTSNPLSSPPPPLSLSIFSFRENHSQE